MAVTLLEGVDRLICRAHPRPLRLQTVHDFVISHHALLDAHLGRLVDELVPILDDGVVAAINSPGAYPAGRRW